MWLQDIPGNKYEYELNVLVTAHKEGMQVTGIDIKTIYENNNKNTHFKPFITCCQLPSLKVTHAVYQKCLFSHMFARSGYYLFEKKTCPFVVCLICVAS